LKTTTPLTQKTCKRCDTEKEITEFSKGRSRGHHAWCKPCMVTYQETYKQKKGKEYFRNYRCMTLYGITLEEAEKLLESQGNTCALCKKEVQFLPGFSNAAHIDHCHSSGKVRGILCGNCNTALGKLGDSVETIKNVLKYLEQGK